MSQESIRKKKALEKLAILRLEAFSVQEQVGRTPQFKKWRRDVRVALENFFPNKLEVLREFDEIRFEFSANLILHPEQYERAFSREVQHVIALLESITEEIREYWPDEPSQPSRQESSPRTVQPRSESHTDSRKVFVVHGRMSKVRDALFAFLHSIGLHPVEWSQAVAETGKGSPFVGEILDAAFSKAQAVVVLMTPEDHACLRPDLRGKEEPAYETEATLQPRQNVLFEAGMAMGRDADRTIIIELGKLRPFSDGAGRHIIRIDNSSQKRQELVNRLKTAGCSVDTTGTDWHTAGDFQLTDSALFADAVKSDSNLLHSGPTPGEPSQYVYRRRLYYKSGDDVPFCPYCFEASAKKAIHLFGPDHIFDDKTSEIWHCPSCQQRYTARQGQDFRGRLPRNKRPR